MKVLAFVTDAFGGRGGIAQYNRDFLSALASAGHRVTVLPRLAPDAAAPPPSITQHPARIGRTSYSFVVAREVLAGRPDIVFCGHLYMAPLAWLAARIAGARLILETHGIEAWSRPNRSIRFAVERADIILCVSRYTRARVLDWAVVPPERVVVVSNTVGDMFTPGDGGALRALWKLEGKKVVLAVGRMDSRERYKGHDRVIAALPEIVVKGHDIVYVVIGEGDDVERLRGTAIAKGVAERVWFIGPVDPQTLVEAYRMADLFVMPSTGEGFGIAFLEAMACGTSALGLDAAGARDALGEGQLGTVVNEDNLTTAICAALSRPLLNTQALSRATHTRFGRDSFGARVCGIFNHRLNAA